MPLNACGYMSVLTLDKDPIVVLKAIKGNMPLFGVLYAILLDKIERFSMPCINIGPWGKDFHKLIERVLKEDLFIRTPRILNYVIAMLLTQR